VSSARPCPDSTTLESCPLRAARGVSPPSWMRIGAATAATALPVSTGTWSAPTPIAFASSQCPHHRGRPTELQAGPTTPCYVLGQRVRSIPISTRGHRSRRGQLARQQSGTYALKVRGHWPGVQSAGSRPYRPSSGDPRSTGCRTTLAVERQQMWWCSRPQFYRASVRDTTPPHCP